MSGTLYLVPTPIGNLSDISDRCRETLANADFIAAEDTRVSLRLLNHLDIKKPLVSYYEHNKQTSGMLSAVTAAHGPGMAVTVTPASAHSRTKSSPGSEMAGEPASVTMAQLSPPRSRSTMRGPEVCLLCS